MVTRTFTASNLSEFIDAFQPFSVGMDSLLRDMYNFNTRNNNTPGGYPPYNIITVDEDHFMIEMAIAGFAEDEITVTQKEEDLMIKEHHLVRKQKKIHIFIRESQTVPSHVDSNLDSMSKYRTAV